jgi:hypothetical protein
MWILALTLRLLNVGKMAENTEETLLSFGHLLKHIPILGASLLTGSWTGDIILMPYRPLIWYGLLALLGWGIFTNWQNRSTWKSVALTWLQYGLQGRLPHNQAISLAILAVVVAQLGIYLAHFIGLADHPTQARFFLPLTFWASLLFCWSWASLQRKSNHHSLMVIALLLWVLYFPQGQQGRFINQLILNRETKHIYEVVLADPRKDVLYIHERPGQIVVLERGAVSIQRAERELETYQKNLQQGLIQELVYLRRTDTATDKDLRLLHEGDWLEEQRFMITIERELVVLRHRKSTKVDIE